MIKVYTTAFMALIFLKVCAANFTNFSLYGDEAQYWIWSQDLSMGYFSKPPLIAWLLSAHTILFGHSFLSLKIFPILIYFFIFYSFYQFCLNLNISKNNALICAFSFLIIPAASISSFIISTDLLLLLFWTLGMTQLLKLRERPSLKKFFLLGVFLGLAFLSKYAAVYFLLSFVLLMFFDKKLFLALKNNLIGCLFFLAILTLILLPNIYWNINNEWITFSHTKDNANLQNMNLSLYEPFKFLVSQALMLGPVLLLAFFYLFKSFSLDFENKFLLIFSLPVFFIVLIESFLVRANANWAAPALISTFLLMFRLVSERKQNWIFINFITNYVVCVFLFISILTSSNIKIFDRINGIENFVFEILDIAGNKDIAVSDRIIFSNITYKVRSKPNKIYMPYKNGEAITNHFQISAPMSKDRNSGFFLIGDPSDVSYLTKENEVELLKEFDVPFSSSKLKFYEVVFK